MTTTFTPEELERLRLKIEAWPSGSPFTEQLRQRLRKLGGQHAASTAANDRHISRDDIACEVAAMRHELPVQPW